MHGLFPALAAALLILGAGQANAQSPALTQGGDQAAAVISAIEAKLIRDYFRGLGRLATGADAGDQGRAEARADVGRAEGRADAGRAEARGKGKAKGKSKQAPPGLAKREQLPPGLAKRDTLPPGLRGRGLPQDLSAALPRRPPGQELRQFENDIVLLETATGRVLDILRDVFAGQ